MKRTNRVSRVARADRAAIAAEMLELHESGLTIHQIADRYSVSRQAISARLIKCGIQLSVCRMKRTRRAASEKAAARLAAREHQSFATWGCSYAEYLSLRCKPMRCFQSHRAAARQRGIGWELKLWDWWMIWHASGHWAHRGRGQGYVMCRKGDEGPYAAGNVFVAPAIINSSDQPSKITDLPIGVSRKGGKFRAVRGFYSKKYDLGLHDTPELAHAAYLSLGPIGAP